MSAKLRVPLPVIGFGLADNPVPAATLVTVPVPDPDPQADPVDVTMPLDTCRQPLAKEVRLKVFEKEFVPVKELFESVAGKIWVWPIQIAGSRHKHSKAPIIHLALITKIHQGAG